MVDLHITAKSVFPFVLITFTNKLYALFAVQRPIVVCVVYVMVFMHSCMVGHKSEFTVFISCIYCEIW